MKQEASILVVEKKFSDHFSNGSGQRIGFDSEPFPFSSHNSLLRPFELQIQVVPPFVLASQTSSKQMSVFKDKNTGKMFYLSFHYFLHSCPSKSHNQFSKPLAIFSLVFLIGFHNKNWLVG